MNKKWILIVVFLEGRILFWVLLWENFMVVFNRKVLKVGKMLGVKEWSNSLEREKYGNKGVKMVN